MDFKKTEQRYTSDAGFNKMVDLFRQLIEEHGFLPSEIREGLFYAQYLFELNNPGQIIRTQDDWQRIADARILMQQHFGAKS